MEQPDIQQIINQAVDKAARETLAVARESKYQEVSDLFSRLHKEMEKRLEDMRRDMLANLKQDVNKQFREIEESVRAIIDNSLQRYIKDVEDTTQTVRELDKKSVKYDLAVTSLITVSSVVLLGVLAKILGLINL